MKKAFLAILFFLPVSLVQAQEVSVFMGWMMQPSAHDESFAGQIEYKQHENGFWAWSLAYLNEGHFPDHHRDGYLGQVWFGTGGGRPGLSLAAGIGPHYYFDTIKTAEDSYADDHGWGAIASVTADWRARNNWLFQVRSNLIESGRNSDRLSVMAGLGYSFKNSLSQKATSTGHPQETENNEVSLFAGRSIINSFQSEEATAMSLEYRRSLLPYLDGTLSWLYEGHNSAVTRNGFCAELWGIRQFVDERIGLGFGAGGYHAVDLDMPDNKETRSLSLILSATASYRFERLWDVRLIFHRIVTSYDKDADVILAGVGYRF